MRNVAMQTVAVLALCVLGRAQNTTQTVPGMSSSGQNSAATQASPSGSSVRIAPGSVIPVQLTKTLDAKKAKIGDSVEAKVTQDMKAQSGELIVPKDTKILGHVTVSQAHTKEQAESQLGISFDQAAVKDKGDVSLPMSIQAIVGSSALGGGDEAASGSNNDQSSSVPGGVSGGGRPTGMNTGMSPAQNPSSPDAAAPHARGAHPAITSDTQGVVGIQNLRLAPGGGQQGSVITSDKGNVKLEGGTFMLLRVNR